jgi:DNA helicase-2/ATP-dependent DNA helicase PcrA
MSLTKIQNEIITSPLGASLVTAGAGSGKTRVLTHRIVHLIQNQQIPSERIVALTFTNKAAGEMRERIEKMLGCECRTFLGTFHSFCARFLRMNIEKTGRFTANFSIYATADTQKAIKTILTQNNLRTDDKDFAKTAEWHIGNMKNNAMTPDEYKAEIADRDDCSSIMRVIRAYQQYLVTNNAMDFDDLLTVTLQVLNDYPEILAAIQGRFDCVLVDEFQDTNLIQYKIAKTLAVKHGNIMCVGDEDQCIYTWRGASIENLNLLKRDFPNLTIYKLEQNFRSAQNIVDLANRVVSKNNNRLKKVLFSELSNGIIETKEYYSERDEASAVVLSILNAIKTGGYKYNDFAILMRMNALSRAFEEQLLSYNIPHIIWGGFKFYDRAEIKIVLGYLRALVNPRDSVALFDVINFPRRGVGDSSMDEIRRLIALYPDKTPYDIVRDIGCYNGDFSKKALSGIKQFTAIIENLREINDSFGLFELAASLVGTIGLDEVYKSKSADDPDRLENVYQLEHAIKQFAGENPGATLAQYLQNVSLLSDADTKEQGDAVVISTIHSAKGLEFNHVFIVGLEDGLFPINRAKNSEAEMEEERRLLYVAITRARRFLSLSYCRSRFMHGERRDNVPSLFLRQVDLARVRDDTDHQNRQHQPRTDYSRSGSFNYNKGDNDFARNTKSHPFIERAPEQKCDITAESLEIQIGTRVSHAKFGNGTVMDIIGDVNVQVKFDVVGVKILVLAYANLTIIEA